MAQTDDLLPYMDITNQTAAVNLAADRQTDRHEKNNQTSRVSQNYDLSQNQKAKAKEVRVCFRI